MPTYSYRCADCGHAFDIHQSFSDDALTECPACGGLLRKQYDSIGVTFNGSGFYRTDSRAEGSGGGAKGSKDAGTGGSGGGSSASGDTAGSGSKPSSAPSSAGASSTSGSGGTPASAAKSA